MQRQSWPRAWLMTDERMGEALQPALARAAAAGAGVIVRHHHSAQAVRRALALEVLAHGALLGIAGDVSLAAEVGATLVHNPADDPADMPFSLSVHDEAEADDAARRKANLVFVSPVFATRSHPNATALGEQGAMRLARRSKCPAYALGGVTFELGEQLIEQGWTGWAGIDAWI